MKDAVTKRLRRISEATYSPETFLREQDVVELFTCFSYSSYLFRALQSEKSVHQVYAAHTRSKFGRLFQNSGRSYSGNEIQFGICDSYGAAYSTLRTSNAESVGSHLNR